MQNLKLAVQKSGRTTKEILKILRAANFDFDFFENGKLKIVCRNFPLEIFFVRNADILQFVESDCVDCGFIGENILLENNSQLEILKKTGLLKCELCVAVPKNSTFKTWKNFENKKIATSYPNSAKNFFAEKKVKIKIVPLSGSVEIAPEIKIADAIVDLVSSGETLRQNNLKIFDSIFRSEVALVAKNSKNKFLAEFLFRIETVLNSKNQKLLVFDAPKKNLAKMCEFLPCAESPTVAPLANENWVSISTMADDEQFWKIAPRLKKLGAKAILVLPIEKIVF